MSLAPYLREQIAWQVIAVLVKRFQTFPDTSAENRNAPFHEAFLQAFADRLAPHVTEPNVLISLSSWLHGLNTTLGASFFEKTAHALSGGEKRRFKAGELTITSAQREAIDDIMAGLKNGSRSPSREAEDALLRQAARQGEKANANRFTADVFIEEPEERQIIAIEIKSVRPNAGEIRGEKRKILEAKAALYHAFPEYAIRYFMGFPFDPTAERNNPTGMDKTRFMQHLVEGKKYLDPKEVLLAGEFWDFLSGTTGTMEEILKIINTIATPQFEAQFAFLQNWRNRENHPAEYRTRLQAWGLQSELDLMDAWNTAAPQTKIAKRLWRQSPFDPKGRYRLERERAIRNAISLR